MFVAADYPFMDIFWTMIIFFGWVIWIWTLVMILSDVFRRSDLSGWAKAGWTMFVIFLPFLGVLTYLIVHGSEMGERRMRDVEAAGVRAREGHAPSRAGNGAAAQIADAKRLLDTGAINETEYAQLKSRVLH